MRILLLILVFFKFTIFINCGRILIVHMAPFTSTANVFYAIVNTLAPYHQISFYTIMPRNVGNSNVTIFPLKGPTIKSDNSNTTVEYGKNSFGKVYKAMFSITKEYIEETYRINRNLQQLISSNETFDLFFSRVHLTEHLLPLSNKVQASFVLVSPSNPVPWLNTAIGNPVFMSYSHNFLIEKNSDTFLNRVINYMTNSIVTFIYEWSYIPQINKISQQFFPPGTESIEKILKNASLLIINNHESMGYSFPYLTNVIQIGGLHCHPPKPLPKDLEEFIQNAKEQGVIYFSLGSAFDGILPKYIKKALMNIFKKIPQRILWKTSDVIENIPDNVMISKWFPQQDILGHDNIKLFITHGGMLSLQEAVYHGVPVLAFPLIYDQLNNADFAQKMGYGKCIKFDNISEETLFKAIHELMYNKKYSERVQFLSKLMRDQPLSSAQQLVWWTDFLIRYKGLPLYRPRDNRYSWYNIIELDIFIFFVFVIFLILILSYITIYFISNTITKNITIKIKQN